VKTSLQSIITSLLLCPLLAVAITPARPRDVFCISTHVVVGTVVTATPKDCRIDAKREGRVISDCIPKDLVGLVVEISEVLGQRNEDAGYPREVGIDMRYPVELTSSLLRTLTFPSAEDYGSIAVDFSPSGPITQQAISNTFEGQQFIFALQIHRSDFGRDGQRNKPYRTNVWRLSKKEWIIDLLKSSDGTSCPKLIPH
jgi:hypothetical protein